MTSENIAGQPPQSIFDSSWMTFENIAGHAGKHVRAWLACLGLISLLSCLACFVFCLNCLNGFYPRQGVYAIKTQNPPQVSLEMACAMTCKAIGAFDLEQ